MTLRDRSRNVVLSYKTSKMDGNYTSALSTHIVETLNFFSVYSDTVAEHRYQLSDSAVDILTSLPNPFNDDAYRESTFLSKYSRKTTAPLRRKVPRKAAITPFSEWSKKTPSKEVPRKERWCDVVIRCIEGTISHYVSHQKSNGRPIQEDLDDFADEMAMSMYRMEWSPPGRGLYAMGTDHTYRNGSAALNNCYAVSTEDMVKSMSWLMDMLMCGGGVGFDSSWKGKLVDPDKKHSFVYSVPDTRQGWVSAMELLLGSYTPTDSGSRRNPFPRFDYSLIRKYGEPIIGFGGTASGPKPLRILLSRIEIFLDAYIEYSQMKEASSREDEASFYVNLFNSLHDSKAYADSEYDPDERRKTIREAALKYKSPYDRTRLIADVGNSIADCVVAGNVRRSAQIYIGEPGDSTFVNLKNWEINPIRSPIMGRSNNTVRYRSAEQFTPHIKSISDNVRGTGEPGILNLVNTRKYARMGHPLVYRVDIADLINPCGEINLESFEPCCLSAINPYNCRVNGKIDIATCARAAQFATFYSTVVTTIPHHWKATNDVITKNRRIGVSYSGIADVYEEVGQESLVESFESLYSVIREANKKITTEMGIAESIRVTTVKPEGTLSIIMGTSAGVHFPIVSTGKRRIAYDNQDPILKVLREAHYPIEESTLSSTDSYVIYPIKSNGKRATRDVKITEKFMLAQLAQEHYSDNSVSFTGDFNMNTEAHLVEGIISEYIEDMKSISMMPQYDIIPDQYKHMPFEQTTPEVYEHIKSSVKFTDWSSLYDPSYEVEDVSREAVSYCTGDTCTRV